MHFSDDTSAFDGKKREALLGKGAVNNQFNAFIMNHLKDNGVESHLIEVIDSTDSLVYKLDMFPIECVIRNRASGSICKRLGTEDGLVLENPLFEFFLKDDDLGDPLIKDEHILFAPNSFTPNGDGNNDSFIPEGVGIVKDDYQLLIFDRWGSLIFESNDPKIGWDGRANNGNKLAQIDTYVWKVILTDNFGKQHSYHGHVNLIR